MWSASLSFVVTLSLVSLPFLRFSEGTWCYQCDSWTNSGCGEDDSLYDKEKEFLVNCHPISYSQSSNTFQSAPQTCLKEITYFHHDKNSPPLDPYHRFNRPHVLRHCGISLNPAYTRGEEYYDRCFKTDAVVHGIRAERWICTCTGDACNSVGKNALSFALLIGAVLASLIVMR